MLLILKKDGVGTNQRKNIEGRLRLKIVKMKKKNFSNYVFSRA